MIRFLSYVKIIFVFGVIIISGASYSSASFFDNETSQGNLFTAASWPVEPESARVVVNELMWMGSVGHTADEWIELRNMTSTSVDLSGWTLSKNTGVETIMLTLPAGASIPAGGYYLVSNYSNENASSSLNVAPNYFTASVDLSNSALQIKLYNGIIEPANLIDTAGNGGTPLAGINSTSKKSMSRNPIPNDGTQASNWFTDVSSNGTIYWDVEDNNYGTPGGSNV